VLDSTFKKKLHNALLAISMFGALWLAQPVQAMSAAEAEQEARMVILDFVNTSAHPRMTLDQYIDAIDKYVQHIPDKQWQDFRKTLLEVKSSWFGWFKSGKSMVFVQKISKHKKFLERIASEGFGEKLDNAALLTKVKAIINFKG
jgi:hypothetical protein